MVSIIEFENKQIKESSKHVYILLNKPIGYVTTSEEQFGRDKVLDLVKVKERIVPVGRLDMYTSGALILTNDGDFANTVMHPRNHIAKIYRVTIHGSVTEDQVIKLSTGVEIDGRMTMPSEVRVIEKKEGRVVLEIIIYEGRNRQIRKMCDSLGLEVARLKRTQIGSVKLGMLKQGDWRNLTDEEVHKLTVAASLDRKSLK